MHCRTENQMLQVTSSMLSTGGSQSHQGCGWCLWIRSVKMPLPTLLWCFRAHKGFLFDFFNLSLIQNARRKHRFSTHPSHEPWWRGWGSHFLLTLMQKNVSVMATLQPLFTHQPESKRTWEYVVVLLEESYPLKEYRNKKNPQFYRHLEFPSRAKSSAWTLAHL